MRNIFLILILFYSFFIRAQSTFNKHYDTDSMREWGLAVIVTQNNEFIIGGGSSSPSPPTVYGVFVIKVNCAGDTVWNNQYFVDYEGKIINGIFEVTNGYMATGGIYDSITNNTELFLLKLDNYGNVIWFKTYGLASGWWGEEVVQTLDGKLVVAGSQGITGNYLDGLLMKTDSAGNLLWSKSYGCGWDDIINSLSLTDDGGFILSGYTYCTPFSDADTWLLKTDSTGNMEWEKKYGIPSSGDGGGSAIQTLDGGYVLISLRDPSGYLDPYLIKTDSFGNIQWTKTYTNISLFEDDYLDGVRQLKDSGFVAAGGHWNDSLRLDGWLVKTDKNGDSLWTKTFGNPSMAVDDYLYDIELASDGGFVIAGSYLPNFGSPYRNAWLVKTDSNGCVDSSCNLDCITCGFIAPGILTSYDTFTTVISSADSVLFIFWDTNSVARSRLWDFGDGYTSGTRYTTHVYSEGGTYTVTLTDVYGSCSDTVMKTIVIIEPPPVNDSMNVAICDGDSMYLSGTWQKAGGSYYDTIIVPYAPDTARITTLTINPTATATATATICMGDSIYLGGSWQKTAGNYYDTLNTVNGCDSIITTTLTVNQSAGGSQQLAICSGDSVFLSGSWQKAGGSYYDTLTAVNGCDSIITTTLTVNQPAVGSQQLAICSGDSVFLSGSWQKAGGSYYDTLTAVNGCDSVIETALAIDPLPLIDSLTVAHASGPNDSDGTATAYVSSGTPPYTFIWSNGQTAVGSQQSTINNLKPDTYMVCVTDSNGCTPVQGCGSAVVSYVVGGTPLNPPKGGKEVTLYPNPVGDEFTVEVNLPANENITIELYDIMGREIIPPLGGRGQKGEKFKKTFTTGEINNGIYFMQVKGGNFSEVVKVAILH